MKQGLSFWYAAAFMFGAIQLVALPILVPSHIYQVSGSMFHSGSALAFVGLSGFIAPLIGGVIDRYKLHAAAQSSALVLHATAMVIFAFVNQTWAMYVATFLIGLGSITLMVVNPSFIVAAGLDKDHEALCLTRMNQSIFVGAIVMGALLALVSEQAVKFSFLLIAVMSVIALLIVRIDNVKAAAKLVIAHAEGNGDADKGHWNLTFITFLLAVFIAMFASSNQVAQGPNLFEQLFAIDKSAMSVLLMVSSIISLVTLDLSGRLLNKMGAGAVWVIGLTGYAIIGGVLSYLVIGDGSYFYLPLLMHLLFMQFLSMVDMVKPAIVAKVTTLPPASTQGYLLFAIAGGYAAGTSLGGVVGQQFGMERMFMFVAACALLALMLAIAVLTQINRSEK
ncbi:MFS transporter [Vibrio sp. ZSDZ65]|uniref:MFS transporter n=1 Tax=Vibrio qingdaonensis TaxID=2829491 RepID=A0A9X3CNL9_9VIBR|nr:MFS transporter [Vibrio qingdaonensis]MCW8346389.1 MFS transporter [Vibrio qingdaonensis]